MSKTKRKKPASEALRKPHQGSDLGPAVVLRRGERVIDPASDRGAPKRARNVTMLVLTDDQNAAAEAIRIAFLSVTAALFPKRAAVERVDRGPPTDFTPVYVLDACRAYKRWHEQAEEKRVELVIDHVMDGHSCASLDWGRRWRKGTAAEIIRYELDELVRLSPWITSVMAKRERMEAA